jgi:integrase
MAKPKDTAFLEQHGPSWRVRVKVPDRLRPVLGVSKLVVPLHTDSLAIANRDKHRHIHAIKQRIAEAEVELRRREKKAIDPRVTEGLDWRRALTDETQTYVIGDVEGAYMARLDELEASQGAASAGIVSRIAYGAVSIGTLADEWLEVKPLKPRQKLDYRRAVAKLETWLLAKSLSPTVEAITKGIASDYRDEAFLKVGIHPRTANKDLSVLSGLWKHAERKALVEANPWRGQSLPETASTAQGSHKRPLSDTEVAALVTSEHASPLLRDAISILALSGMRTEELARMKVGDLRDLTGAIPYVALRGTKTQAARREVPVHPDALSIILRRIEGKESEAFLLDELATPRADSAMERGQPLTKAFGRLRKRLGIDEREDGARQANVDLHGLRRWFISKARDALNAGAKGFTLYTVAETVGHAKGELGLSMTSRYAGRETMEAKAACVRAVKLPFPKLERPNDGPPHHSFAPSRRPGHQPPESRSGCCMER